MNRFLFVLLMSFSFALKSFSAPHPGAGSSALSNPLNPYWQTQQGYEVNLPKSSDWQWGFLERADITRLEARFTKTDQAVVISLFLDKDSKSLPKSQEYTNLGFQVINSGSLQKKNHQAQFWDLYHPEKKQQVRQYLLKTEKGLLSFSCSGDSQTLQKFSNSCSEIFQSIKMK